VDATSADAAALAAVQERVARARGDLRGLAEVLVTRLGQPGATGAQLAELLSAAVELLDPGLAQQGLEAVLYNPAASLTERELGDGKLTLAKLYAEQGLVGPRLDLREQASAARPEPERLGAYKIIPQPQNRIQRIS